MNNNRFFSITIPTYGYNGRGVEFLEFSLNIISKQVFKNFEVILSDHSIDNTIYNIYSKWVDKLDIKYYKNEQGRGIISPNINNAMKQANGLFIKILFQDDFLYDENSLLEQFKYLYENPNCEWLMTKFYHSNDGKNYYRLYNPIWNDLIWTGDNTMGCPSGMTLKNNKNNLTLFDESLNWLMDVDFYTKMYKKYGQPDILNKITYINRTWGERLTDTITQELKDKEFNILKDRYGKN